jgi:TonB family protein
VRLLAVALLAGPVGAESARAGGPMPVAPPPLTQLPQPPPLPWPTPKSPGDAAPVPLAYGSVSLSSVEDLDAQIAHLSNLIWTLHYASYPAGLDGRGRTLQQDTDEYLLPPADEARLKALRRSAAEQNTRGDGTGLRKTLNEAQALLAREDFRASILYTYAGQLRTVEAHRAAWAAYAERVPAERRDSSQQHIDAAAAEYSGAMGRALQMGAGGTERPQLLAAAVLSANNLRSTYNKERGELAAELSDGDREQGKLVPPYERQGGCAQIAPRTSGRPTPFFGQMLHGPDEFYPASSRRMGFEGSVLVKLWISDTGCLERAEVWQSSGVTELDKAAMQWAEEGTTYLPAEKDQKAVSSTTKLPVRFALH